MLPDLTEKGLRRKTRISDCFACSRLLIQLTAQCPHGSPETFMDFHLYLITKIISVFYS